MIISCKNKIKFSVDAKSFFFNFEGTLVITCAITDTSKVNNQVGVIVIVNNLYHSETVLIAGGLFGIPW